MNKKSGRTRPNLSELFVTPTTVVAVAATTTTTCFGLQSLSSDSNFSNNIIKLLFEYYIPQRSGPRAHE